MALTNSILCEIQYVDGGVLDNKPFTHTIREIFHRTAHRLTSRFLIYVEPDPVRFDKAAKAEKPDIFKAVIDSLTSIPGYESIADDLALLEEHNDRVEQHTRLTRELDVPAGATQVGDDVVATLYRNSRLNQIARRAATGLLREKGRDRPLTDPRRRRAAAELIAGFSELVSRLDESSPGSWEDKLRNFGVYFRLRRLFHCSYDIREKIRDSVADAPETPLLIEWRKAINCQITLLEIVRHQMEALVDQADIVRWDEVTDFLGGESDLKSRLDRVEEIWQYLSAAYNKLLDVRSFDGSGALPPDGYGERWQQEEPAPWLDAETLKGFRERLVAHRRSLEARISDRDPDALSIPEPTSTDPTNLLHVADAQEEAMFSYFAEEIGGPAQEVFTLYQRFAYIDAHLFPMEHLSGLESKDYIRTVRFSLRDAKCGFSNKSLEKKLSGDAVHHFGGFFKRSWRANDILWGRLDGVCQLAETLLGKEKKDRLRIVMGDPSLLDKVGRRVLDANSRTGFVTGLAPEEIFPHAGSRTHRALGDYIRSFVAGSLDPAQLGEMKELLVEAAQLEIIYESLGDIVADAVKEQLAWNRFRLPEEKRQALREQAAHVRWDFADSTFVPGDGDLDPLVTSVAARAAAENAVREFRNAPTESASRPKETALGKEFERYRVGNEELTKDVPRIILLQVLANALLVLRNCVVTALGERGFDTGSIKKNRFYRWGISLPLHLFRFLVLRKRANPHEGWLPPGAVILVSVVLLSLGGVALNREADFSVLMALLLVLLPAVGLAYGLRALWIRKFKRATWVQRLFRLVVLLIVLAAVGLVGYYFGFLFQKILMAGLTTWELASATLPIILLTVLVVWAGSRLWTKIQTDPTEAKS